MPCCAGWAGRQVDSIATVRSTRSAIASSTSGFRRWRRCRRAASGSPARRCPSPIPCCCGARPISSACCCPSPSSRRRAGRRRCSRRWSPTPISGWMRCRRSWKTRSARKPTTSRWTACAGFARYRSSRRWARLRRRRLPANAISIRDSNRIVPPQPEHGQPGKGTTMAGFRTLDELGDIGGKRVLVRVDLNVPVKDGAVTDTTRIERVAPTITELVAKGAKVILLAHFGRPKGEANAEFSLGPIARATGEVLGKPVAFASDCIGAAAADAVAALDAGGILLLENTRFHKGEEKNDPDFARALAANGDIYVNDAFSAAHRAHASTEGLAHLLPAYAGRTMQAELEALEKGLGKPAKPVVAIVG